jgi:hypothetical protein
MRIICTSTADKPEDVAMFENFVTAHYLPHIKCSLKIGSYSAI